jgi:hypothetical protein
MIEMTALDMVGIYETLVRRKFNAHYRVHRKSQWMQKHKDSFKRLKVLLDAKDIPFEDYMEVQFMVKGRQPMPNQFGSKAFMDRWEWHKKTDNAKAEHYQQEIYLASLIRQDYTVEEALNFDQFLWYFRIIKLKEHCPDIKIDALWKYKAIQELKKSPALRKLVERGDFGETI